MLRIRTILVLVGFVLAASAFRPVDAGGRESPPRRSLVLDPISEGVHADPLSPGESIPLTFEPGQAPFQLLTLTYEPEADALWATLRHVGERPVSAWSLVMEAMSPTGKVLARVRRNQDWSFGANEGATLPPGAAEGLTSATHEYGLLRPGQTHRVQLPVPVAGPAAPSEMARLVLSIGLTVYEGGAYEGADDLATEILGSRRAAAQELAYWTARLEDAAARADSGEDARTLLRRMREDLDAADEAPLPSVVQAVRNNIRNGIRAAIRPGTDSRIEVRQMERWFGSKLERWNAHLPRKLPDGGEEEARR